MTSLVHRKLLQLNSNRYLKKQQSNRHLRPRPQTSFVHKLHRAKTVAQINPRPQTGKIRKMRDNPTVLFYHPQKVS
jgi:hypothetical protein